MKSKVDGRAGTGRQSRMHEGWNGCEWRMLENRKGLEEPFLIFRKCVAGREEEEQRTRGKRQRKTLRLELDSLKGGRAVHFPGRYEELGATDDRIRQCNRVLWRKRRGIWEMLAGSDAQREPGMKHRKKEERRSSLQGRRRRR